MAWTESPDWAPDPSAEPLRRRWAAARLCERSARLVANLAVLPAVVRLVLQVASAATAQMANSLFIQDRAQRAPVVVRLDLTGWPIIVAMAALAAWVVAAVAAWRCSAAAGMPPGLIGIGAAEGELPGLESVRRARRAALDVRVVLEPVNYGAKEFLASALTQLDRSVWDMATVAVRSSDADVVADLANLAGEAEAVAREATRLRDQLLEDRSVSEFAADAVAAPGLKVVLDAARQSIGYAGETVGELSAAVTEARAAHYHPHLLTEGFAVAEAPQAGPGNGGGGSGL